MRFLHTSDWQLGLRLRFVPGEAGARLRAQRFDTVRLIARVALEREVGAVLVAGDVFDDNAVSPATLQLARDALAAFAPVPVLLLPGNHDALTPDSALARLDAGEHVRLLRELAPLELAGGVFFPCPLIRRHSREDPALWLPAREPADQRVRVAVAHGGVLEFSETTETPNRIDARAVIDKGFDYLALGDWHSEFRLGPRAVYPGTPEPTSFAEAGAGRVLIVEIPEAGAAPDIEAVSVGRARWLAHAAHFDEDGDVTRLGEWFDALEERSWTLVGLALEGHLSLAARAGLDGLLEKEAGRLLYLDVRRDEVVAAPTEEDLHLLRAEGFVGLAADRLRAEDSPEGRDALRVLHRLLAEART